MDSILQQAEKILLEAQEKANVDAMDKRAAAGDFVLSLETLDGWAIDRLHQCPCYDEPTFIATIFREKNKVKNITFIHLKCAIVQWDDKARKFIILSRLELM